MTPFIKIPTKDGSWTLKNPHFNECYHSSEGAITETLYKHVYPAFKSVNQPNITILDICFGLGFNTFLSILNRPKNSNLKIYSPELDEKLVKSLINFEYPKEFDSIKDIINEISKKGYYKDSSVEVEVAFEDARTYITTLPQVDIVYQDAFSPKVNTSLWTIEYFRDIDNLNPQIITTYSVATPIRYALYTLGYTLYTHEYEHIRKGTIASKHSLNFEQVDFEQKLQRVTNPFYYTD
ncbi:MAG: hypothetical protein GXO40_03010 [Epsilonproteobacteria bacterium]|nr:hypothetical protein [Campylobacterota bacterium]